MSVALMLALAQETAPPEPAPARAPASVEEPPPIDPRDDGDETECDDDERTVEPPCAAPDDDDANEDDDDKKDDDDNGIKVGPAEPGDDDDAATLASEGRVTLGGRLGVAAGNVGAVPFFLPGPGAFFTLSQRLVAFNLLFAGADGGLSLGINENSDSTSIAGYKGRMFAGLRLSFDWIAFEGDVHGGLTSVALLPVPRMGLGAETRIALPVCCEDEKIITLDAEGRFDADLLLIAPAPAISVEAGATWYIGPVFARGRVGIDADAVVAIIANTVSASVFAAVTLGLNLDFID